MLMMLASGGGWLLTLLDLWGFLVGCLEMAKTTPQSRAREWGVGFHSKSPDQALGFRIWFSVGLGGRRKAVGFGSRTASLAASSKSLAKRPVKEAALNARVVLSWR